METQSYEALRRRPRRKKMHYMGKVLFMPEAMASLGPCAKSCNHES